MASPTEPLQLFLFLQFFSSKQESLMTKAKALLSHILFGTAGRSAKCFFFLFAVLSGIRESLSVFLFFLFWVLSLCFAAKTFSRNTTNLCSYQQGWILCNQLVSFLGKDHFVFFRADCQPNYRHRNKACIVRFAADGWGWFGKSFCQVMSVVVVVLAFCDWISRNDRWFEIAYLDLPELQWSCGKWLSLVITHKR